MNINEIKLHIQNGGFDKDFLMLYGDTEKAQKRYYDACCEFEKIYPKSSDIRIFSAPGRTEVGGNHTDHQHGCVLAGGVDMDVIAIVSLNGENVVRIKSQGYDMDTVDLSSLESCENEKGYAIFTVGFDRLVSPVTCNGISQIVAVRERNGVMKLYFDGKLICGKPTENRCLKGEALATLDKVKVFL